MSENIFLTAYPSVADSLIKGQLHRWKTRPIESKDNDLGKFTSFKGRGYVLLELGHTIIREPYRAFKNFLLIAERVYNFVRSFFESLFREPQTTWKETGERGKELLSCVAALFMRPLTFVIDLFKLAGGLFVPAAAIKTEKEEDPEEDDKDLSIRNRRGVEANLSDADELSTEAEGARD